MTESSRPDDETLEGRADGIARPGALAVPQPGQCIGRYVVLAPIGHGAVGAVYSAYDPQLDRRVALKLLLPSDEPGPARRQLRLLQEAKSLARITHPNVVTVHDVGMHDGRVFLAMEFVEGTTLKEWFTAERRPWHMVLELLIAAGRGLAAAHASGLVHRDFKPANVMVSSEGRVCVTDFGLARAVAMPATDDGAQDEASDRVLSSALTRDGAIVGTPGYMAPEQQRAATVGPLADQFAFCVSAYEALYGERPFPGIGAAEIATAVHDGRVRPAPPDRVVPLWLRRTLLRGLSHDASARYPSMLELLAALQRDPRRRARKIGIAVATVGVALAGFGAWKLDGARKLAACDRAAATIDAVWNDDARATLVAGMIASGTPFAPTTAELVVPWIDREAEAWRATQRQVCVAATVDGTMSETAFASADACISSRRTDLESLIARLTAATALDVRDAVKLASGQRVVTMCSDPGWLARQPALSAEVRARVDAIDVIIKDAHLSYSRGDFQHALTLIEAALDAARDSGSASLLADTLMARARISDALGESVAAEQWLLEALNTATSAGADDQAARAAELLARVVGLRQRRTDAGLAWASFAEAWHDRIGLAPDAAVRISTRELRARLHLLRGERDESLADARQAVELREATFGVEHPELAGSLELLGLTYAAQGDHEQAFPILERTTEMQRTVLGEDHPDHGKALNNFGTVLASAGEHERAAEMLEHALAVLEPALGPDHPDVADVLSNLADAYVELEPPRPALALRERALAIQRAAHRDQPHPAVASCLVDLGRTLWQAGDRAGAATRFEEAAAMSTAVEERDPAAIALAWVYLGEVRREAGDAVGAADAMKRALAMADEGELPPDLLARARLEIPADG